MMLVSSTNTPPKRKKDIRKFKIKSINENCCKYMQEDVDGPLVRGHALLFLFIALDVMGLHLASRKCDFLDFFCKKIWFSRSQGFLALCFMLSKRRDSAICTLII